jgi:RNA polymerase sigma-70 factor, ECF subfamily
MSDSLPVDLDRLREQLLVMARMRWGKRFQRRLDASDIVQSVLLQAWEKIEQFKGNQSCEFSAWVRAILNRTIINSARDNVAAKRDTGREQHERRSGCWLSNLVIGSDTSPSMNLQKLERDLEISDRVSQLPDLQREAVILRYGCDMSIQEISERLSRTPPAVASLLRRAMLRLRDFFPSE